MLVYGKSPPPPKERKESISLSQSQKYQNQTSNPPRTPSNTFFPNQGPRRSHQQRRNPHPIPPRLPHRFLPNPQYHHDRQQNQETLPFRPRLRRRRRPRPIHPPPTLPLSPQTPRHGRNELRRLRSPASRGLEDFCGEACDGCCAGELGWLVFAGGGCD
jgi:hypothetical protein